ncbi:ABC transporter [Betaproteobacteria bacterium]|nr:ABC transporter [Betaproteobacteria bacterium]GHT97291.1 ABC transporter [Betaproteobacteria bacterium]GHU25042.1 ABC transporter [Betaproteobacteria bacterium]GHU27553.1 ABC transporter [Betaproteobacteria bacterium]
MPILELKDISVSYPNCDAPVLQLPRLEIGQGEAVAILGPSGSGKTTLVSIISGLEYPATGSVCWDEINLNTLPEAQKEQWRAENIGLVMQDFHLYPGLSAFENILLPARFRYWHLPRELKRKASDLLDRIDVHTGSRPIEKLSRGEMQRVAVARALLMSPPVLIADEPTASLDVTNGEQVIELLLDLVKEQQMTLLAVTHDRRLAGRMTRCLTLENGRLIKDGVNETERDFT